MIRTIKVRITWTIRKIARSREWVDRPLPCQCKLAFLVLCRYLEPDLQQLLTEELDDSRLSKKFQKLNKAIASLVSHARAGSDLYYNST